MKTDTKRTGMLDKLFLELSQVTTARTEREMKFFELLNEVQSKFPGESRFDTALRYIKEAEARTEGPSMENQT